MDHRIVLDLIACGADLEAAARLVAEHPGLVTTRREHSQETVLHWLAVEGHHHAVEALARAGADVDARDSSGETPLMAAAQLGQKHMVALLLRLGANPSACSPGSGTVLHHWTRSPEPEILRLLVEAGADVDAPDETGDSALRALVGESASRVRMQDPALAAKVAPFLASLEIEAQMPDRDPRELAQAVRDLAEAGADVDRVNYGQTPLMEAAGAGDMLMVRTLLELGADPGRRDDVGDTAADVAEKAGHPGIGAFLRMARRA